MSGSRHMAVATLACVGALTLGGCGGDSPSDTEESDAAGLITESWVTIDDVSADLAPRLEQDYGQAQLLCGLTDISGGGFAAGPLREGNAMGCTYISDQQSIETDQGAVWLDLLVLMVSDNSYTYAVTSGAGEAAEAQGLPRINETVPEWLYRDGLTCEQLGAPLSVETVPGPDFAQAAGTNLAGDDGLSYPELVYYWFDAGRPADLDPSGEGRPCSQVFPAEEVEAFFGSAVEVTGSAASVEWTDPLITTNAIRSELAAAATLPEKATQVDCSLVGPVARGSVFTCAPRLNREPDSRVVAVVRADGGFLVGPSLAESAAANEPPVWAYAGGLSCEQIRQPVTVDTFSANTGLSFEDAIVQTPALLEQGLSYLNAVLYSFTTKDATMVQFDAQGWPCTEVYPADQVAQVQGQVQKVVE